LPRKQRHETSTREKRNGKNKVAEFILLMEGEHPALKAINEQRKLVTKLQHLRLLPVTGTIEEAIEVRDSFDLYLWLKLVQ
jgi:hypothetical protein